MMKVKYSLRSSAWKSSLKGLAGLLLLTCFLGCGQAVKKEGALSSAESEKLTRLSAELNLAPVNKKMLLVIPTNGCGSCIKSALEFTAQHDAGDRLTTVVSGRSKKLYLRLMNQFKVPAEKVIFDKGALSHTYGLISIFPVLFQVGEDDEIIATKLTGDVNIPEVLEHAL